MKVFIRSILYSFVFLLVYGNNLYSGSSHSPLPRAFAEQTLQDDGVYIDHDDFVDVITETFPCIVEENSSDNSDDDSDHSSDERDDSTCDSELSYDSFRMYSGLLHTPHSFVPSSSPAGKAAPLYLLNRVFRI